MVLYMHDLVGIAGVLWQGGIGGCRGYACAMGRYGQYGGTDVQ